MKKSLVVILSFFVLLTSISVVFAVSGANDFIIPPDFEESNAAADLANYNNDGFARNIHLMIQRFDSFDEAKGAMNEIYDTDGDITVFYDEEYGDIGCEEVIESDGNYYLIGIYSTGGHIRTYSDSSYEDIAEGLYDFNELNNVSPLAIS